MTHPSLLSVLFTLSLMSTEIISDNIPYLPFFFSFFSLQCFNHLRIPVHPSPCPCGSVCLLGLCLGTLFRQPLFTSSHRGAFMINTPHWYNLDTLSKKKKKLSMRLPWCLGKQLRPPLCQGMQMCTKAGKNITAPTAQPHSPLDEGLQ